MDAAQVKRSKRMRRQILEYFEAAKAIEWTRGRWAADTLTDLSDSLESDAEFLGFATDLIGLGLLESKDMRTLASQRLGLEWLHYRITAKGTALLAGVIPVEPLISDDRIR